VPWHCSRSRSSTNDLWVLQPISKASPVTDTIARADWCLPSLVAVCRSKGVEICRVHSSRAQIIARLSSGASRLFSQAYESSPNTQSGRDVVS